MKTKILQEFINSDIKILSEKKLKQYIDFCILNNEKEHTVYKTAFHHILPKALYPEYANLNENLWNGTYLSHYNHYYAHWLLTEAINNYSMLSAFCAMHNKDIKSGRINKEELISEDNFQRKMEERNKEISVRVKKEWADGIKNQDKTIETKYKEIILSNGTKSTIHKESAKKAAATMSIKKDGELSIREKASKKAKNTYHKEIILADGTKTTKSKEISKKMIERLDKKSKKFIVKNVFDKDYQSEIMLEKEVRKISALLSSKTKENYLGSKPNSNHILTKNGKSHLIGLYVLQV